MTKDPSKAVYPIFSPNFAAKKFNLRPLPPIKPVKSDDKMCIGRIGCSGRVGIFLVLGVILIVLGLVSLGLNMNIGGITTSKEHTELMPLYIPCGLVIFSGLVVSFLFWKRFKVLVLMSIGLNTATAFLCIIVGVITITHIITPLRNMTSCRYYTSQRLCQCFSPYQRDVFNLDFSENDLTKYAFEAATGCEDIQHTLPNLLYGISIVFCIAFVIAFVASTLALLVLRAERLKRGFLGEDSYEEVYTVSGSSQDQSDSESEVNNEVVTSTQGHLSISKNSTSLSLGNTGESTPVSYSSINRSNVGSVNRSRTSATDPNAITPPQLISKVQVSAVQGQRLKTPGLNDLDLGKESLANRYRISKTPDNELNVRQRLSKTPDREIGSNRRNSFTASKRLSKSCDSLESFGNEAQERTKSLGTEGKKKSKLKDHRRKGKRAATVHTLDTDQLLLILNLQMRYLQEAKDTPQNNSANLGTAFASGSRRAVTPQPVSHKSVIPPKIRSHTPQPRRAAERLRAEAYAQNLHSINNYHNQNHHTFGKGQAKGVLDSENSSRRTSESSERTSDLLLGNVNCDSEFQYFQGQRSGSLGNYADSYLHSQQIKSATQNSQNSQISINKPYQPYIFSADVPISGDQHFVTYSDSMLSNIPSQPKSRPSVQNGLLPTRPLQRSPHQQLPATPVSRRSDTSTQLHQQPIHRGTSAFKVVDRKVPSRSPSIGSDRSGQLMVESSSSSRQMFGKVRDEMRDPILENFSLSSKQGIDGEADLVGDSIGLHDSEGNFILRDRNYRPTEEALPPYSGPPSYKDHVSSSNTSVTSSLSSNPDDIYSFPKQRSRRNSDLAKNSSKKSATEKRSAKKSSSSDQVNVGSSDGGNSSGRLFRFTGAAVTGFNQQDKSVPNSSNEYKVKGHGSGIKVKGESKAPPQGMVTAEISSGLNRVKQIIVPEDYYTNVSNVQRSNTRFVKNKTPIQEPEYGNTKSGELQGYNYLSNNSEPGQIGSDEKYQEYEDVYETGSKDGDKKRCGSIKESLKPGDNKSKNRTYASDGVSNVHGISDMSLINCKMSADVAMAVNQGNGSVSNVRADVKKSVPNIQLNSLSINSKTEDDDDDVFIDSREKMFDSKPSRIPNISNNNYEEINDLELVNRVTDSNNGPNHLESTNQDVLDSGYMKMTLPSKVIQLSNSETYGIAVHLTGPSGINTPYYVTDLIANQNHLSGFMTQNQSNKNPSLGDSEISTNQNGPLSHVDFASTNQRGPICHEKKIMTNQIKGQRVEPAGFEEPDDSIDEEFEETGV
ncbi:uncharacterized protein LOC127873469 [Dreissena polymorpha]|uniref:Uncharacterized protein n=1 Tax=Dreissena polymorpha TaxID=45954 RepID=A0A9D4QXY8_DREPO|nr:uncharacterized protein LOC127873469 [Dreissena polymorpha]XP_052273308.1 uncharacterized protein LOC127873469 [Dreissena polymorpha]KAH3847003.1 hypothetical protein DPMN_089315 [Dreissena polymorpha]